MHPLKGAPRQEQVHSQLSPHTHAAYLLTQIIKDKSVRGNWLKSDPCKGAGPSNIVQGVKGCALQPALHPRWAVRATTKAAVKAAALFHHAEVTAELLAVLC